MAERRNWRGGGRPSSSIGAEPGVVALRADLYALAGQVEAASALVTTALVDGDADAARRVLAADAILDAGCEAVERDVLVAVGHAGLTPLVGTALVRVATVVELAGDTVAAIAQRVPPLPLPAEVVAAVTALGATAQQAWGLAAGVLAGGRPARWAAATLATAADAGPAVAAVERSVVDHVDDPADVLLLGAITERYRSLADIAATLVERLGPLAPARVASDGGRAMLWVMADTASSSVQQAVDSSSDWVAEHTRRYVETGGEDGQFWRGVPTLVLVTTGRTSGQLRRNALIYGVDGDNYVVVASKGGDPKDPSWYRNLVDDPEVVIQVGPEVSERRARTASADQKARLWPQMVKVWPAYEEYQAKTDRDIPVVVLEPR